MKRPIDGITGNTQTSKTFIFNDEKYTILSGDLLVNAITSVSFPIINNVNELIKKDIEQNQ